MIPMYRMSAILLLVALLCSAARAQSSAGQKPPTNSKADNDSSSQDSQAVLHDTPSKTTTPDATTSPQQKDKPKSGVKKKLGQLVPDCVNLIAYHTCATDASDADSKAVPDSEYAKDMDVGNFYLKDKKNYAAATMRFRDALRQKPNDPDATFKLAQSLQGSGANDEAAANYTVYLQLEPSGRFAAEAKKALERLQPRSAVPESGKTSQAKDSH
jgi:cytoskeletal protein RodZ